MQVDHPSTQFPVFSRRRRRIAKRPLPLQWIVESPMFDIALPTLHHRTPYSAPSARIGGNVSLGEVQVLLRHGEVATNPAEAKFAIRTFEGQRMCHWHLLAVC